MSNPNNIRRIAGVTMQSIPKDVRANAESIKVHMARAAQAGANLVLFPEMCLTGYVPDAWEVAIESSSPVLEDLAAEAARLNLAASIGYIEDAGDKKYVAQAFLHQGQVRSVYRKIYSCEQGASDGDAFEIVDWDGATIATMICKDLHFPAVAREHAKRGALLILHPAAYREDPNTPYDMDNHNVFLPRARAKENGVFLFTVNASGSPYNGEIHFGNALLAGPDGRILGRVDRSPYSESMLIADIDLTEAQNCDSRVMLDEEKARCELIQRMPPGRQG